MKGPQKQGNKRKHGDVGEGFGSVLWSTLELWTCLLYGGLCFKEELNCRPRNKQLFTNPLSPFWLKYGNLAIMEKGKGHLLNSWSFGLARGRRPQVSAQSMCMSVFLSTSVTLVSDINVLVSYINRYCICCDFLQWVSMIILNLKR